MVFEPSREVPLFEASFLIVVVCSLFFCLKNSSSVIFCLFFDFFNFFIFCFLLFFFDLFVQAK